MAKFLRFVDYHFTDALGRPDVHAIEAMSSAKHVWHLRWMYEHYALPIPSQGVSKVNVYFVSHEVEKPPSEVLGIATVEERFDLERFQTLSRRDQCGYFLTQFHAAMLRCADHFGWNASPLEAARERIVAKDYRFTFWWKKPLASPDRQHRAQAYIEAEHPGKLFLVFSDKQQQEIRRCLLSIGADAPGVVQFLLGDLRWIDAQTVKITHENSRDFWLCTIDGGLEFHYPRAEAGDPHGEYDLGRMYYDGQWILQDQPRGRALIESAAKKGFRHAINFLKTIPD